jgi:hypothetical protein
MNHGGRRHGAGRRKGVPNKSPQTRELAILKFGIAPLDVLLEGMSYWQKRAQRLIAWVAEHEDAVDGKPVTTSKYDAAIKDAYNNASEFAAKAAAYVHPRMAPTSYGSRFDATRLTDDERRTLTRLLAKGLGIGPADHPLEIGHIRDAGSHA